MGVCASRRKIERGEERGRVRRSLFSCESAGHFGRVLHVRPCVLPRKLLGECGGGNTGSTRCRVERRRRGGLRMVGMRMWTCWRLSRRGDGLGALGGNAWVGSRLRLTQRWTSGRVCRRGFLRRCVSRRGRGRGVLPRWQTCRRRCRGCGGGYHVVDWRCVWGRVGCFVSCGG